MRVKDLFEAKGDLLDRIRSITTKLVMDKIEQKSALSQLYTGDNKKLNARLKKMSKVAPDLKLSVQYLSKATDRFWSDDFHTMSDVMKESDDLDDFMQAIENALYDIGDKVVEYFTNKWNHEPGYEPPDIQFDPEDVTIDDITAAFAKVPEFKQLVERDKEREAMEEHRRAEARAHKITGITEANLTAVGAWIDAHWDEKFGGKMLADVQKNYTKHGYSDWFPTGTPKNSDDMLKQMSPSKDWPGYKSRIQVILEWMSPNKPKRIAEIMILGIKELKLAEKIAAHSTRLQEVLKRYGHS